MRTTIFLLGYLGSALFAPLGAQAVDLQLHPGSRVRVSSPAHGLHQSVATYVATRNDSLILGTARVQVLRGHAVRDTVVLAVPADAVTHFELSLDRASNFGRWAGRGALIGMASGLALGVAMAADESGGQFVCSGAGCIGTGLLAGAVYGGLIGGILGALTRHDVWVDVGLPRSPANVQPIALLLPTGGFALGAVLRL
jgi:hypothetical protein